MTLASLHPQEEDYKLFSNFFLYLGKLRNTRFLFIFLRFTSSLQMLSVLGDLSKIDGALLSEKCKILTRIPELIQKGQKLKWHFKNKIAPRKVLKTCKTLGTHHCRQHAIPVQGSRRDQQPHCPQRLGAGESTNTLGAVRSRARGSMRTWLPVTQNSYTTHDETRPTAGLQHHHHLPELSKDTKEDFFL